MKRDTGKQMNRSLKQTLTMFALPVLLLIGIRGIQAQDGPGPLLFRSNADQFYVQALDIMENGGDPTQNFLDALGYYFRYLEADTTTARIDSVKVYEKVADSYRHMEDWEKAVGYYQWLIDNGGEDSYLAGNVLFAGYGTWQLQGLEAALPYYARYIELEPSDTPQQLALAGMYLSTSQFDKAADHYLVLLAADPTNQDVVNALNNLRIRLTPRFEAITLALVEHEPGTPKYLLDLGQHYYGRGDLQRSIEYGQRYLAMEPDDITGWELVGDAHKRTGNQAEALNAYRQILRLDARNLRALTEMTGIYVDQGNINQAITQAKRALAVDPDDAGANAVMGDAAQQWGMRRLQAEHPERELTKMPFNYKEFFQKVVCERYYAKARRDSHWRNHAIEQINYLMQFFPEASDRFMAPPAERVTIEFPPPA